MSDITEAIMNGECCEQCMCEFAEGKGFPRLCRGCDREYEQFLLKEVLE